MLIQGKRRPLRPTRSQRRRPNQSRQYIILDNALIKQRPKERNLLFPGDLHPVQFIRQRIDDNQNIAELGRNDVPSVVPPVFRPDDMHLIISYVTAKYYSQL